MQTVCVPLYLTETDTLEIDISVEDWEIIK
jgi:hypothetical protein